MSKKSRDDQQKTGGIAAVAAVSSGGSRWADYFWANLIFFALLTALLLVVRASCTAPGDEQTPAIGYILNESLFFLLLLFGGGFLLVTLFDAAYEFFAGTAEKPVPSDETPKA